MTPTALLVRALLEAHGPLTASGLSRLTGVPTNRVAQMLTYHIEARTIAVTTKIVNGAHRANAYRVLDRAKAAKIVARSQKGGKPKVKSVDGETRAAAERELRMLERGRVVSSYMR
jgi:hypothetical protein